MSFWSLPRYISAEEHEYTDLIVSGICLIIVSVRPCSKNKITAAIKIEGKPQALNGLCCVSVKLWINLAYNSEWVGPLNHQLLKCFYLFISRQLQTLYHNKRRAGRKTICCCFVDEIIEWTNQMIRRKTPRLNRSDQPDPSPRKNMSSSLKKYDILWVTWKVGT